MNIHNSLNKLIRPSGSQAFSYDVVSVKRMGTLDKVCYSYSCRKSGIEIVQPQKGSKYKGKLSNNIARTRSKIREYALCNEWKYFATLTIDPAKFDRYNLSAFQKALSEYLHNYNRNGVKVRYLLIPEFHKDGAIHMHGLLSEIPEKDLFVNDNGYLDWAPYSQKFGFISLGEIKDNIAVAYYITKYITKGLANTVSKCNAHMYYCSKGLNKAERIYKAEGASLLVVPDYVGEYAQILNIDNTEYDYHDYIQAENVLYDYY